jgi:hypothetical protein
VAAVIAGLFYLSATKQTQIAREQTRISEQQKGEAQRQAGIAKKEKLNADAQAATAISNDSRALTGLSRVALEDGRTNQAVQLALAAWPRGDGDNSGTVLLSRAPC